MLQPALEKLSARIAVSEAARRTLVEHLGGDAVLIPNGVSVVAFAGAAPLPGWPGEGGTLGFLGRFGEPRKGFAVLREAFVQLAGERPGLRLLVAGPGHEEEALRPVPPHLRDRIHLLGLISEHDKARMLRSVDVYVAPNTGGESFGIILAEAMAAGTPVVASDIEAFRRVLADGTAGVLTPVGDAAALARAAGELLDDPARRAATAVAGAAAVQRFDWPHIAEDVLAVYETVTVEPVRVTEDVRTNRLARLVGFGGG
jgi:phosphatidylinositol alpha-mannosyltransferase